MELVLEYLNQAADYINWVIAFHLAEYAYLAGGVIVIAFVLLFAVRSKIMYFFPACFAFISLILLIMIISGASQFEWDYMLLLVFVNFAAGYVLYVFISMVLSKPQLQCKLDHEKKVHNRLFESMDKTIDALVYELYGLTKDEIQIVEENIK